MEDELEMDEVEYEVFAESIDKCDNYLDAFDYCIKKLNKLKGINNLFDAWVYVNKSKINDGLYGIFRNKLD